MDNFSYIDPGTGSVFLQAVIGFVLGALVVFKSFFIQLFNKIKSLFIRSKKHDVDNKK